jgi:lysozyme
MTKTYSDWCTAAITAFEGFVAKPYRCSANVLTQGYGHTSSAGGEPIGGVWSKEKALKVLYDDLQRLYLPAVLKLLKRVPTQYQLDALVSFAFNCGVGALAKSSILKHHNRGDFTQAAGSFAAWNKAAGKVNQGLVRRRASEALMYQGVMDENWDGARDRGEALYGDMPQAVTPSREKLSKSRKAQATVGAAIGTGAATVPPIVDALTKTQTSLEKAQPYFETGTLISLGVGCSVLALLGYALYAMWQDAGRPLPSFLRGGG